MDDAKKELWPVGDDELSASTLEGETERKRMNGTKASLSRFLSVYKFSLSLLFSPAVSINFLGLMYRWNPLY